MVEIQQRFVLNVSRLVSFAYTQGFRFTFGDAWAQSGHLADSLHYERLAIDLNLFVDDVYIQTDHPAFTTLGAYWKTLDPLCRWGGDIPEKRDLNHFSMVPDSSDDRI